MKLAKPLFVAVAAGAIGVGAWTALPAGAASRPTVQLDSSTVAATPAPPTKCETEEWPDAANGQPARLKPGAAQGYYLWHDATGWHLEVTHPTHDHVVFSGWITTNGTIEYQRVDDEHNDLVKVGPNDHRIGFDFNNYGAIDGVHFATHCADWLEIHLFVNGHSAGVQQVYVGHGSTHPLSMPFTIDRRGVH
jgi:hypothetical protein